MKDKSPDSTAGKVISILYVLGAVVIWGGWMSATRIASKDGVAPIDVAFLRYAVPAVLLLPVWLSALRKLPAAPLWALVAMLGWGAPFLWLVAESLEKSNVVYLATIVPCTMPIFAVIAQKVFFKATLDRKQRVGFTLIGVASLIVVFSALAGTEGIDLYSLMLMLFAAAGWACYVVAFPYTGFTAAQGAAWVSAVSTLIIVLIKLFSSGPFLSLTRDQLIFNSVTQGLLSGFVAVIFYTIAIERMGSARAASFSVIMPVTGALIAWLWLAEVPLSTDLIALCCGVLGVSVINGVIRFPGRAKEASSGVQ